MLLAALVCSGVTPLLSNVGIAPMARPNCVRAVLGAVGAARAPTVSRT
ncbi:hypothetical protein ACQP2U_09665 [Nocardia sp. CA-084685]